MLGVSFDGELAGSVVLSGSISGVHGAETTGDARQCALQARATTPLEQLL